MTHTFLRVAALGAATALTALSLSALPAVSLAPVESASAATAVCYNAVDARYPNLTTLAGHSIDASETGVSAYIGGDFSALNGAQETEGIFAVGGNANFYTHTYSNIGVVGIGSLVTPVSGSDVLVTGGDINIGTGTGPATTVEVSNSSEGNIVAGGTVTVGAGDTLAFNGAGGQTTGVATPLAGSPYVDFKNFYTALSSYYAGLAVTGTVDTSGPTVIFDGDNSSAVQVFTVADGSVLGSIATPKKFSFTNIPADAIVIVNVTDTTVTLSTDQLVSLNGTDLDWNAATAADLSWAEFTQSLFWNFPSATALTLGNGSQIPGSIDAPSADVTLLASTNGRVYAGGSLELGDLAGSQSGLEMHNYSFRGYDCSTTTGDFAITKSLTDPDTVVTAGRTFTGTYECTLASTVVASGTWSVTTTSTYTVADVATGATCVVVDEDLSAPPTASPGYAWASPTFSPASVVVGDATTVTIDVQNSVTTDVGSLAITKSLTDPDGVVTAGRTFTGAYSCSSSSTVVASGTWSVTTTTTDTITNLPTGASCTLTEDLSTAPSATDSSYLWEAVVVSPSTATIVSASTVDVEVQNSVRRALGDLEMVKVLDDPYNVVDLGRVYTGTFQCTHLSADVTPSPGTWSTTAGAAPVSLATGLPIGTVCTLAEDALTDPPLAGFPQYQWRAPSISPASITIAEGVTGRFTVTNTVFDPFDVLAQTGTDLALPLGLAGGAFGLGAVALILGYRRRRSA